MVQFANVFSRSFWTAQRTILLIGFIGAVIGNGGQIALVDSLVKESSAIELRIRQTTEQIAAVQNSYFSYYFAAQQGSIIFALDPSDTKRSRGVLGDIYKGNLLDRATPFRFILFNLAVAKVINYNDVYAQYVKLNDAARQDFSFANYQALNNFEGELIDKSNKLGYDLIQTRFELIKQKDVVDHDIDARRRWLLIISAIGSVIMLISHIVVAE